MWQQPEPKQVTPVETVLQTSQRGIYARIDENRRLLALLQAEAPDFLKKNYWVEGWIGSQDQFLLDLLAAVPVEKRTVSPDFPAPWPGSERKARRDPANWGLPETVVFRVVYDDEVSKKAATLEEVLQLAESLGFDLLNDEAKVVQILKGAAVNVEGSLLRFEAVNSAGVPVDWAIYAYPLQQVVLTLQGTRWHTPETILSMADEALQRIRNGEDVGEEGLNALGYRFEVKPRSLEPSCLRDPALNVPQTPPAATLKQRRNLQATAIR